MLAVTGAPTSPTNTSIASTLPTATVTPRSRGVTSGDGPAAAVARGLTTDSQAAGPAAGRTTHAYAFTRGANSHEGAAQAADAPVRRRARDRWMWRRQLI